MRDLHVSVRWHPTPAWNELTVTPIRLTTGCCEEADREENDQKDFHVGGNLIRVVTAASLLQIQFSSMIEEFKSLRGQLLLDSGQLRGSFFHRAVVLICHHDADGAFGLVLNQPTENKVGDVLVADLPEGLKESRLFLGGPVQTTALSYLHGDAFLPDANVIANLSVGHSLDELVDLSGAYSPSRQVRCFAGYAGWSGGQLEGEMERKAWLLHPASLEVVFSENSSSLWKEILMAKGWKYRLLAEGPEDISRN